MKGSEKRLGIHFEWECGILGIRWHAATRAKRQACGAEYDDEVRLTGLDRHDGGRGGTSTRHVVGSMG
jgi:hypothetical protein